MPKSPGPYARSSDMYSHMGTMPRLNLSKSGKSLAKAKSSQSCEEKGTPSKKSSWKALLPSPESPEMSGTPDAGIDLPSTTGQEEWEEEEAALMDIPGEVMVRINQEPAENVSSPGIQRLSSSLAPNHSQTFSPDKAVGVVTIERHLPETRQESPIRSSLDRYGPVGFALPSAMIFFPAPQGKGRELGHSRVSVVPLPHRHSASSMYQASGIAGQKHSVPWPDQELYGRKVSCG